MGKIVTYDSGRKHGTTRDIFEGNGTPEGSQTGSIGDIYIRLDGGASTVLYIKESGSATNTGWVAYGAGGGATKYYSDVSLNGSETQKDTDVSSVITDARIAQWQLADNANNYEIIYCPILATSASNVRILTETALPSGSYRLIGIE